MSRVICDIILIGLFVVYLIRYREKSLLFALGVCWFSIEILSGIAFVAFYETVSFLPDLFGDRLFDLVNYINIGSSVIRIVEYVLLFFIVFCFFVSRRKKQKQLQTACKTECE